MRNHTILSAAAALAAALTIMSCQVVIGVSDLEVTTGAGGAAGTECKTAADCGAAPECHVVECDRGTCKVSNASAGTACGGSCVDAKITAPGTCNGSGVCSAQPEACPAHLGCDPAGKACNKTCDTTGGCASDSVCFTGPKLCMSCGTAPPQGQCPGKVMGCDACEAATATCVVTCDSPGKCDTNRALSVMEIPARLECGDQCDNITVACNGAAPCEVVCGSGCNNLKLDCGIDGGCKLTCNGTGCVNATVTCGGNSCDVSCKNSPVAIHQECNNSCSCTKFGCK